MSLYITFRITQELTGATSNPPPTVDVLRGHLGSLGLIKSGRKAELIERLRKFSENPKEWDRYVLSHASLSKAGLTRV